MAKDYAKHASYSRKPKRNRELDLFVISLIVLFVLGAGYWFYAHKVRGEIAANEPSSVLKTMRSFFHKKENPAKPIKKEESIAAKEEPEVQFNFYNELPNSQVTVEKDTKPSSAVPAVHQNNNPAKTEKHLIMLQFGTYDSLEQASEARISYLLAGAPADVVKVGDRFQIQAGPYATLNAAKALQKKLQKKGIDCSLHTS